jgi:hypothetical protein
MTTWTRQQDGTYTRGPYTVIKIPNTRTRRKGDVIWEVRRGDARLSLQPTLMDAKLVVEAHDQ